MACEQRAANLHPVRAEEVEVTVVSAPLLLLDRQDLDVSGDGIDWINNWV
jgi:hypothetical protein